MTLTPEAPLNPSGEHVPPVDTSDQELTEVEERKFDTMVEQGVLVTADAMRVILHDRHLSDAASRVIGDTGIKEPISERTKTPHYSRRGGRAFPEPSDSSLDNYWNVKAEPVSEEQDRINREGAALVRAVGKYTASEEFKNIPKDKQESAIQFFIETYRAGQHDVAH